MKFMVNDFYFFLLGGAAHLPGMTASLTTLPVLGVPIQSKYELN